MLTKGHRRMTTGSILSARDAVWFLPIIAMRTSRDVQGIYTYVIYLIETKNIALFNGKLNVLISNLGVGS